jgi:hypothetical protein
VSYLFFDQLSRQIWKNNGYMDNFINGKGSIRQSVLPTI